MAGWFRRTTAGARMWKKMVAGVFNVPTLDGLGANAGDRIAALRAAAVRLQQYGDQRRAADPSPLWTSNPLAPSMVFVAPEYMFTPPGFMLTQKLNMNRFLSKTERDSIVADLQRISADFGRELVFVPGTIAYREELPNQGAARSQAVEEAKQQIRTAARAVEANFKAPGQSYLDVAIAAPIGNKKALTAGQKLKELDVYKKYSGSFYTASNVAYMLNNGRIVGSYAKRSDFHERLPGAFADTVFVPGIKPGRATVGGINFGVEICLDHGLGVLKGTATVTGDLPRIHMICSASVEYEDQSIHVRTGGYLLHASSDPANAYISRLTATGWEEPEHVEVTTVSGVELRIAVIEIDV